MAADLRIYFITPFVCTALGADMVSPGSSEIKKDTEEKVEEYRRHFQTFM